MCLPLISNMPFILCQTGPVGSNCSAECKQMNTRQVLGTTVSATKALRALVMGASSEIHLRNKPGLRVDTRSFSMGRLEMMCETPGRVLTRNRLCGKVSRGWHICWALSIYTDPPFIEDACYANPRYICMCTPGKKVYNFQQVVKPTGSGNISNVLE